jgi:hypothetical protein
LEWDNTEHICAVIGGYIGYGIGYQYRMKKKNKMNVMKQASE